MPLTWVGSYLPTYPAGSGRAAPQNKNYHNPGTFLLPEPKTECVRENEEMALTRPVKVHPGTSRCTDVLASLRSKLRCSASVLMAALLALYAALPGGFVMPCLLPVITMADGGSAGARA